MEAILITIEEYERLVDVLDVAEYRSVYNALKERESVPDSAYRDFDDVVKDLGLSREAL
jgi:hypothetical protein